MPMVDRTRKRLASDRVRIEAEADPERRMRMEDQHRRERERIATIAAAVSDEVARSTLLLERLQRPLSRRAAPPARLPRPDPLP